ncbi:MAG: dihydroneopterin aldolase [Flavobacteriales bacterium]
MSKISVNNIKVYAYHGCWEEEAIIGGEYIVDVQMDVNFKQSAIDDDLSKTADYVVVKEVVYREMAIRAKLIENVAYRIYEALKSVLPLCNTISVRVTKLNAPMGGQVESVSVEYVGE